MFTTDSFEEQVQAGEVGEENDEITQEDAWAVITSFFEEKGLVRQQLDSFNEFVSNTIQEIIDENNEIIVKPEAQYYQADDGEEREEKEYKIKFGQIYLSKPLVTEADDDTSTMFPKEARLRNLTCVGQGSWAWGSAWALLGSVPCATLRALLQLLAPHLQGHALAVWGLQRTHGSAAGKARKRWVLPQGRGPQHAFPAC